MNQTRECEMNRLEESGIGLGEPQRRERLRCAMLVTFLLSGIVATAAHAGPAGAEATAIHLRYSRADLSSPAAARKLLARIGDAALEACGASTFSLAEYKIAVRRSRCWQEAVDDATRRIGSPTLKAPAIASNKE